MRNGKGFFKRGLALVLALCMVITGLFVSSPTAAEAATNKTDEYTDLFGDYNYGDTTMVVKKGSYYFKLKGNESDKYTVYISKKKNSGYKKISKCKTRYIVGNSKQMYFTVNNYNSKTYELETVVLYKYVYKTGKITKIKNLPKNWDDSRVAGWTVEHAYGDNVYLELEYMPLGSSIFIYNAKSKKLKKLMSGELDPTHIASAGGKYMIIQDDFHSDATPSPYSLWKITSKGTKRIKTLGYNSSGESAFKIVGNYIYYASYKNSTDMGSVTFYKCKIDGTGVKKLGVSKKSSEVYVTKLTNKYAIYRIGGNYYSYTFATKKTKTLVNGTGNFNERVVIEGNYIYYSLRNKAGTKLTFYKSKIDGTGKKKLGVSKTAKGEDARVDMSIFTSKYATYHITTDSGYNEYKYTFATKKTKFIKKVVY